MTLNPWLHCKLVGASHNILTPFFILHFHSVSVVLSPYPHLQTVTADG